MNYILFDDATRNDLLPLTFTRPVADIRIGILTIREKWEKYLKTPTSTLTEKYLSIKYPMIKSSNNILINSSVLPTKELVKAINELKPDQSLVYKEYIIAMHVIEKDLDEVDSVDDPMVEDVEKREVEGQQEIEFDHPHMKINYPWDIFAMNREAIEDDFKLITHGRKSKVLSDSNRLIAEENIFVEAGAKVECAIINASSGPVYIGKDAEVMEGCVIRGPFSLGDHSYLKMGAKIYGPTTIGPHSKVGGEVNNCVIFGYSNKAHDGFLGQSVLGEWCNIGADSNNSNLKNTYEEIKVWNYPQERFIPTGLQFCGLIMGDHSKCGINTMFNTGTVVGVNANIIGHGFQRNFIASFSWGNSVAGYTTYEVDKAIDVAKRVYERRGLDFTQVEKDILKNIFELTFAYRKKNYLKK
jgi:UDP-N-acetylglucosamine diphosphorylase/glucosamine-1-phosphate N-acetyltransferase